MKMTEMMVIKTVEDGSRVKEIQPKLKLRTTCNKQTNEI